MLVRMLVSVVSARPAMAARFFWKRFTSSDAKCCASDALPPLPKIRILPPLASESRIALAACSIAAADRRSVSVWATTTSLKMRWMVSGAGGVNGVDEIYGVYGSTMSTGCRPGAVAFGVEFHARRSVGAVNQAAIGRAAAQRVEGDHREPVAVVGFPLVRLAVAVRVFIRAGELSVSVVLHALHFAVAFGGDVDARQVAGGVGVRPGVFDSIFCARESDFF